ncbi:trigger factor [Porphyromonadaceae bacterium W3.11]|nr:trigger factor [Porphyromonadaceae bacterium W3.11]
MNISILEQKGGLTKIALDLVKADYEDAFKSELKKVSKTAKVSGFREGKVPTGMIQKMYGPAIRVEVLNRVVGEAVGNFLEEKEIRVIGAPVPDEKNNEELLKDDFTIHFNIAEFPKEHDFDFSDKTFTKYDISVSNKDVEEELERAQQSAATLKDIDTVTADAVVGGDIAEVEGDVRKEGGIVKENVTIYPQFMKDSDEQAKFIDAAKTSVVVFNPYKAFDGNEAELSSLFGIDKEEVESLKDKEFSFQIETIRSMQKAKLGKEFYNMVFGEGEVSNKEEAKDKIREFLMKREEANADYKFSLDFINYIKSEKAPKLELAEDTIVEWYKESKQRDSEENADKDVDKEALMKSLREEIYVRDLAKEHEVTVTEDDLKSYAMEVTRSQFAQMGWANPDPKFVEEYALKQLSDSNFAYSLEMNLLEQKLAKAMQEKVNLEKKEVTSEEFKAILNPEDEEETKEESAE